MEVKIPSSNGRSGARTAIPNAITLNGARMETQEFLELLKSPDPKALQKRF